MNNYKLFMVDCIASLLYEVLSVPGATPLLMKSRISNFSKQFPGQFLRRPE